MSASARVGQLSSFEHWSKIIQVWGWMSICLRYLLCLASRDKGVFRACFVIAVVVIEAAEYGPGCPLGRLYARSPSHAASDGMIGMTILRWLI